MLAVLLILSNCTISDDTSGFSYPKSADTVKKDAEFELVYTGEKSGISYYLKPVTEEAAAIILSQERRRKQRVRRRRRAAERRHHAAMDRMRQSIEVIKVCVLIVSAVMVVSLVVGLIVLNEVENEVERIKGQVANIQREAELIRDKVRHPLETLGSRLGRGMDSSLRERLGIELEEGERTTEGQGGPEDIVLASSAFEE